MNIVPEHITNNFNILCYVENASFKKDKVVFEGWIAHREKNIKSIVCKDEIIFDSFIDRPDVKEFYPFLTTSKTGFKISLDRKNLSDPIDVVMDDESVIVNVKNFEEVAVKLSGFNTYKKNIVVVDNFYSNPDWIRDYTINNLTFQETQYHKGKRSYERFILDGTKEAFERILGVPIINWNDDSYPNGKFQYCTSMDPIVYHVDGQNYAAMVYLTPDAPLRTGTVTYKSKVNGLIDLDGVSNEVYEETFRGLSEDLNFYDNATLEEVDNLANVYNRLVMFNSRCIHGAEKYFGDTIKNSRYFHLFFFDVQW